MSDLLVLRDDHIESTALEPPLDAAPPDGPLQSRELFAAAHVIPRTLGENVPGHPADVDWDLTLDYRRYLWSWGLGVADAMDTAQRNMGLDWAATTELMRRSSAAAAEVGGALVAGVNTDDLPQGPASLQDIVDSYRRQLDVVEDAGASAVVMTSRHLAHAARSDDDYLRVYSEVLTHADKPVILHWLGPAFDTELTGYWGSTDTTVASETLLRIVHAAPRRVRGIKMSLLDADAECAVRKRLPTEVRMFTGDDYNYSRLIAGDGDRHSDALLGAFAVLAKHASAAIRALDRNDVDAYRRILDPSERLAQQVFARPTEYYKTGVAFLSWLNGHQPAFTMVGGLHAGRSLPHLSAIVERANAIGALEQPDLAAHRWRGLLDLNGLL